MRFLQASCLLLFIVGAAVAQDNGDLEFFEKSVRPLLVEKCQMCHNAQTATSGLDLSTGSGFMKGGASGALISRESPEKSMLLNVVSYAGSLKMPPSGKLETADIATLTEWVDRGAVWPGTHPAQVPVERGKTFTQEQLEFWAFQPVADPPPPAVRDETWIRSDVDRFILARLEDENVKPAGKADKATLLRRAYFDLTGLPPTAEEVKAFVTNDSPRAFAEVVDKLLASPRYGERWGRRWLDVARYADSTGNDEDHRYPYAWRYRDYVIEAFNSDLPYDQFVREQIAGDLMPAEDGSKVNRRGIIATGLLALGPKAIAQQDKTKMVYDVYDEQVDVTSRAFLGMTVACARCHDHKFDPILTRDYYSMINFFANTKSFTDPSTHVAKLLFVPLTDEEVWLAYEREQDEIRRKKAELTAGPQIDIEEFVASQIDLIPTYLNGDAGDDPAALRWHEFLAADQERPYLDVWRNAPAEQKAAEAEKIADAFREAFGAWRDKTRKYREESTKPLEAITMGAPKAPKVIAGEEPLLYDLYVAEDGPFAYETEEDLATVVQPRTVARNVQLEQELAVLESSAMPAPDRASGVVDKSPEEAIAQTVFVRGDYHNHGEPAPKTFLSILEGLDQEPVRTKGSGRLELANWIGSPDNQMTARVMVNRIWQGHFGEGLVRTPNNFGRMGERPTHPELLDYLAKRFVDDGWSIKSMHRRILLSNAYQMSSETSAQELERDPENRLLSRFNRRRLDVEEIRDGLLAIGGSLDTTMGGTMQEGFGTDGENSSERLSINPDEQTRRTIYLPLRRANLPALLNIFDFGDATTTQGRRAVTNVAPQALFMMNSAFVSEQARMLAERLMGEDDDAARVERAYLSVMNRAPSSDDLDFAQTYLTTAKDRFEDMSDVDAWQSFCRILLASNEFIYVN